MEWVPSTKGTRCRWYSSKNACLLVVEGHDKFLPSFDNPSESFGTRTNTQTVKTMRNYTFSVPFLVKTASLTGNVDNNEIERTLQLIQIYDHEASDHQ